MLNGIGSELSEVGRGLSAAASSSELGAGVGGSTPLTGRALEICSGDWTSGLGALSQQASAMAALAGNTSTLFRLAGG